MCAKYLFICNMWNDAWEEKCVKFCFLSILVFFSTIISHGSALKQSLFKDAFLHKNIFLLHFRPVCSKAMDF